MISESIEFAGKTWKRHSQGWVTDYQPVLPENCDLNIAPSLHVVRCRHDAVENAETPADVSDEQVAAASFFLQHQTAIYDEILRQLMRHYQQLVALDPDFYEDLEVESIADLISLIDQLQISIERHAADGFAWMSIAGGCEWEVEHGLGICLWKDIVLDIGTYDTVMSGPDPEYFYLPALEEPDREKQRRSVAETIAESTEAEYEQAELEQMANMPDVVRLSAALLGGDEELRDELVAKGVSLDTYPSAHLQPVFIAIEGWNADLLQRMIDHGAKTNVTNLQGQTPLQAAQETLAGLKLSQTLQKNVLGDMSGMMAGESPSADGLMSMLGELQQSAAEMLSEIDGQQHQAQTMDQQQLQYHTEQIHEAANDVKEAIPNIERIIEILSSHK